MKITRVEIVSRDGRENSSVLAYASAVFDDLLVVRGLRIIQSNGTIFVVMPDRKIEGRCERCTKRSPLTFAFCGMCGAKLPEVIVDNPRKLFVDIIYPTTEEFRRYIEEEVLKEYQRGMPVTVRLPRQCV